MTDLKDHLIKLIKLHGPIPVSNYMTEALTNPKYGYYIQQQPFGTKGDFVTAPEVSQMFGELIGLWFADIWLKLKRPNKVHLIELGPGSGALMADIIRVLKVLPEFLEVLEIHLVEVSPQLIAIQKDKLEHFDGKVHWHETVRNALSAAGNKFECTFIVANEFFDALPIRQFQKGGLGWHERMVTVDNTGKELTTMLSPFPVRDIEFPLNLIDEEINSVIEVSPMTEYVTTEICDHIKTYSGAALFIDYGYTKHRTGETLQAVKKHKYATIYDQPGQADLSAHVNFRRLLDIIEQCGLKGLGPVYQGEFLNEMGIEERVKTLSKDASPEQLKDLISALKRLVTPEEMGTLFKVIAMVSDPEIDVVGFQNDKK